MYKREAREESGGHVRFPAALGAALAHQSVGHALTLGLHPEEILD
jgi:hypothetical protein